MRSAMGIKDSFVHFTRPCMSRYNYMTGEINQSSNLLCCQQEWLTSWECLHYWFTRKCKSWFELYLFRQNTPQFPGQVSSCIIKWKYPKPHTVFFIQTLSSINFFCTTWTQPFFVLLAVMEAYHSQSHNPLFLEQQTWLIPNPVSLISWTLR